MAEHTTSATTEAHDVAVAAPPAGPLPGGLNPEHIAPDIGPVADGVAINGGLGNALTVDLGDGYLQIDTGPSLQMAESMMKRLDASKPVKVIAFSHGHLGYNFACQAWIARAKQLGQPVPTIVAQDHAADLIRQYQQTQPMMGLLLALQFDTPIPPADQPLPLTLPDQTFSDSWTMLGPDRDVHLLSAPSETAGAIAAWIPDVKVLYVGPAGLPAQPNIGMPLWPTGHDEQWAATLERLAGYDADHLVGQYGKVIHGADAVREFLMLNARALRFIRQAVIDHLNAGHTLNDTINGITYPAAIFDHPLLTTGYSSHADIVRQVWGSLSGWWHRNPTELAAVPDADAAAAIRSAITDTETVLATARSLHEAGKGTLALHVIDLLALVPGDDVIATGARKLKADICRDLGTSSEDFSQSALYLTAAKVLTDPPDRPTGIR